MESDIVKRLRQKDGVRTEAARTIVRLRDLLQRAYDALPTYYDGSSDQLTDAIEKELGIGDSQKDGDHAV